MHIICVLRNLLLPVLPIVFLDGAPDSYISIVCRREKRALITLDTDFADIRAYPPQDFSGLIVLRSLFQGFLTSLIFSSVSP